MKPKVLVATTSRWVTTARLAVAFCNAGCDVEVVSPPGHPVRKTSVRRVHPYDGLAPLASFFDALEASQPNLIVPGDDLAARHLYDLHHREQVRDRSRRVREVIEYSLGPAENYPLMFARTALMELAGAEGVRVPQTCVIHSNSDLRSSIVELGFPIVLKADGTSGGDGVRVAQTFEEAERCLRKLQAPPLWARAAKRALLDRDRTLVWPSLFRRGFRVNAQAHIRGREATSAVACWKGAVLADLHFEVLSKRASAGPATVLRVIENADMAAAAEKVVRRLNLSGVIGFDFMLKEGTAEAYLIEMNPRATQVGHLTLGSSRDIPAALYAAVTGSSIREAAKITEKDTIALFPHEWLRNPASAYLTTGYHDIPWEEPELIRACLRSRQKQIAWYSPQRWFQVFSPVRIPRS